MTILEKATEYQEKSSQNADPNKPLFHVCAPIGWINDPNGFSDYNGAHHLFFQYYPYDVRWNSMHWGHCTSTDFIKWEYLPVALAPDTEYDGYGCFSGSALEDNGAHVIVYTGVRSLADGEKEQTQCIAFGDGIHYKKYHGNPVITAGHIPGNTHPEDFRDPKIWKRDNKYYLVAASKAEDYSGQIALFESKDLYHWTFDGIVAKSGKQYGTMWECPDFFKLGETDLLMVSTMEMCASGKEFHNGNNVLYFLGQFDYAAHHFACQEPYSVDYGLDFYAPQSMLTEDNRRIMIGWMKSPAVDILPKDGKWNGMLTIPRELEVRGNRLYQQPVRELWRYLQNKMDYRNTEIKGSMAFPGIRGRVVYLEVEILEMEHCNEFSILIAKDERYRSELCYNKKTGIFSFDRTYSGIINDVICRREMLIDRKDRQEEPAGRIICPELKIQVLLDRYSVEIFVNQGEKVMSSLIYTPLCAEDIEFNTDGEMTAHIIKYDVKID